MKPLRAFIAGFFLALILVFAVPASPGIASFKTALITAVTNSFTVAERTRIADAFASAYGYQATINGSPNPQTKADFAADQVVNYIRGIVQSEEAKAGQAAVPAPTPLPN